MKAEVRCDLVDLGWGDHECADPDPNLGEIFFVQVENGDGIRWNHERTFEDEDQAQALADRVQAHLDAGRRIDRERWFDAEPCYGTQGWLDWNAGLTNEERAA